MLFVLFCLILFDRAQIERFMLKTQNQYFPEGGCAPPPLPLLGVLYYFLGTQARKNEIHKIKEMKEINEKLTR